MTGPAIIKTRIAGEGTVTPPTKESLDRQIVELTASGANPQKLEALKVARESLGE